MTISEQSRHAMYVRLEGALGQEAALILMEHLPPVGWADVATKRDLDHLHVVIRADLERFATRDEVAQLGSELRAEMGILSERMFDRMATQTRTLVFSVLGSAVSFAALTMTAARIG